MPQYKRKLKIGVRWYYKFDYLGKTYHSKAIYYTKQDAAKAERKIQSKIDKKARKVSVNDNIKLLDIINTRLDYIETAKSKKYYVENRYYLKLLYEHFGNIKMYKISKGEIQKLLIDYSKKQKKKSQDNYAVNAMLRSFKALFNYGINFFELDMKNPCIGIEMFPIKKKIKYIPTDEEIQFVLDKCDDEQRLLVEFVRDTGCRISEALNLSVRDVFEGYVILYTRKNKSIDRTPREAKFDTTKLSVSSSQNVRVFSRWCDTPKFLSKKSKSKWNWNNLRHRYASILSKNNTPIFEIMQKLGHSRIETTQNYLQLLP